MDEGVMTALPNLGQLDRLLVELLAATPRVAN